jgi:hypothetical protein
MGDGGLKGVIGFVAAFLLMVGLAFGAKSVAEDRIEKEVAKRLNKVLNAASAVAEVKYGKLKVHLLSREVVISDITIQSSVSNHQSRVSSVRIGGFDFGYVYSMALGKIEFAKDFPKTSYAEIRGFEVPIDLLPQVISQNLQQLGYESLDANFFARVDYSQSSEILSYRLKAGFDQMGEVGFHVELGDVSLEEFMAREQAGFAVEQAGADLGPLMSVSLRRFEIRYDDDSIVPRLNYWLYQNQKTTLGHEFKKLRASLLPGTAGGEPGRQVASLGEGSSPGPASDPMMEMTIESIEKFLENPKSISFVMAPPEPVPIMRLAPMAAMEPQKMISYLNIQVLVNQ